MATAQTAFDVAELLNRELQLQTSEADVTRGLVAYNSAIRHFEARVATRPRVLGDQVGTVTTAASTEATTFPAGVLRIDRLQLLNSSSLPKRDLTPLHRTGSHGGGQYSTIFTPATVSGEPSGYWMDGTNIYWSPLPNATHTVRWYGFQAATAATAATDTFPYPDIVIDPVGAFIAKAFAVGLDDPIQELQITAMELFDPVIKAMSRFWRDGARIPTYRSIHRV